MIPSNDQLLKFQHLLVHCIDAHCHIQAPISHSLKACLVMGSSPEDWPKVQSLCRDQKSGTKLIPFFGCHPWWSQEQNPTDLLKKLGDYLDYSGYCGEIGLDKASKNQSGQKHPFDKQMQVFKMQMDRAIEKRMPTSIHLVRTSAELVDYFKQKSTELQALHQDESDYRSLTFKIAPIMLHSFSGSVQVLAQLESIKHFGSKSKKDQSVFYYSISHFVNSRQSNWMERIQAIPSDRILIESDMHDPSQVPVALLKAAWMVSEAKGWTMQETILKTAENTELFLMKTQQEIPCSN